MLRQFVVEMEITRIAKVVVEARSEAEARSCANDLNYQHEVTGEIIRWNVTGVAETDPASDDWEGTPPGD